MITRVCAIALGYALAMSAPVFAQTTDVLDDWRAFDSAQARGDLSAADLAAALAGRDFAAAGFSELEVIDVRAQLARTLAAAGRAQAAQAAWGRNHAGLRAAIAAADAAGESGRASDLRALLIAQLRDAADAARAAGDHAAAADLLAEAWTLTIATLGDDEPAARFVLAEKIAAQEAAGIQVRGDHLRHLGRLEELGREQRLASLGADTRSLDDPLPQTDTYETIRVFYGTTRPSAATEDPHRAFRLDGRADLSFGSVVVTVPRDRAPGTIPRPGFLSLSGPKDGVHIVLKRIERDSDAGAWAGRLRRSLDASERPEREAFVYVHGHANAFDGAALRTAQLAVDLDMRRGAIFYAWPAATGVLSYRMSELGEDGAEFGLVDVIKAAAPEADTLHLVAHSMGNRVLLRALELLRSEGFAVAGRDGAPFGQVVWASPDVDADTFARRVPAIAPMADGMTLYASQNDRALQLSQRLYGGFQRAGIAPVLPTIASAVTAVDTSAFAVSNDDIINHGDYAADGINDLRSVVWFSLAPDARCPLTLQPAAGGGASWRADPARDGCGDTEFRRAVQAKRLYGEDAVANVEALIRDLDAERATAEAASWRAALAILRGL